MIDVGGGEGGPARSPVLGGPVAPGYARFRLSAIFYTLVKFFVVRQEREDEIMIFVYNNPIIFQTLHKPSLIPTISIRPFMMYKKPKLHSHRGTDFQAT